MSDEKWGAGDRSTWLPCGVADIQGIKAPLFLGEHKHSSSDNRFYVEYPHRKKPIGFDGHHILIGINFKTFNYLKESGLSGDEVRKGGECVIYADNESVWTFFYRDVEGALLTAHRLIGQLSEHSSHWFQKVEREKLVGRKIFYRELPCVIKALVVDHGCVMIEREDGSEFPAPVWAEDSEYYERETRYKVDVLDERIWWWRRK